jgi:hypothetical protein
MYEEGSVRFDGFSSFCRQVVRQKKTTCFRMLTSLLTWFLVMGLVIAVFSFVLGVSELWYGYDPGNACQLRLIAFDEGSSITHVPGSCQAFPQPLIWNVSCCFFLYRCNCLQGIFSNHT